jgi:hypothetical protein
MELGGLTEEVASGLWRVAREEKSERRVRLAARRGDRREIPRDARDDGGFLVGRRSG